MSVIHVEPAGGRNFEVEVAEETTAGTSGLEFRFHVTVDDPVLYALGLADNDTAVLTALVRESFAFLLSREPAGAILSRFDLSVISKYFPEFLDEIGSRLPS